MNHHFNGRVYKTLSTCKLLRLKSFFLFCKSKFLVANMQKIYNSSSKIIGQKTTNKFIKLIYGDIFLGGENASELSHSLNTLKNEGLLSIADYARESLLSHEEKVKELFIQDIDAIINNFKASIDIANKTDSNNSIAIKISSFGVIEHIKKYNQVQQILSIIEDGFRKNQTDEDILKQV
jgi:hypothetical protein